MAGRTGLTLIISNNGCENSNSDSPRARIGEEVGEVLDLGRDRLRVVFMPNAGGGRRHDGCVGLHGSQLLDHEESGEAADDGEDAVVFLTEVLPKCDRRGGWAKRQDLRKTSKRVSATRFRGRPPPLDAIPTGPLSPP